MIHGVFSIFDSKVEDYGNPFFAPTKGAAIRTFSDACADKSTMFNKHPKDYTLFYLGEFDSSNGAFVLGDAKVPLGSAFEFMDKGDE